LKQPSSKLQVTLFIPLQVFWGVSLIGVIDSLKATKWRATQPMVDVWCNGQKNLSTTMIMNEETLYKYT
jgi:hypothetical protein